MSDETVVRLTRAEANEKIAAWFEPKPEAPICTRLFAAAFENGALSESEHWVFCHFLDDDKWLPSLDYANSLDACWDIDATYRADFDNKKFDSELKLHDLRDYHMIGVAGHICCAILYAITGKRHEISD